ncbi:hypothetical protein [Actibacterium lipolyticum]|uniref:Membrane protein 6-pyruvoyl-tetrahydropterin synthase-related domain-containing protein n=1 Tax=Actibacterium lipolyticum TaxID=1524263 RepID=A0A238JKD5_9RHOB|nr:hypothetical protein [Actibacterium lipolyticum]SMX31110.1 hypothetical protein COL8621_00282 [Actibacterium lipolyticum]
MPPHGLQTAQQTSEESAGLRLLLVALAGVVLFHGGLLPFTHGNTYDAFIHMFFGDSYHRSWFDPWEPRWYTGFATTSYPPGTHMAIAGLMHLMPLRAAFVVVQLVGLLLLTVGVFRFSRLWVTARPAGFAALALVLSSSISETVHLFGQLPTIFSLGVFLNGLPYVYRWIVIGGLPNLAASVTFASATTAAHHVTTLFGGVLFIIPLAVQALRAVAELNPSPKSRLASVLRFARPFGRGILLAVLMVGAMVLTVFPYWSWSINDPITQVPIPHGSRESFIERKDLGFVFFVLPWGIAILFLPYVIYKTFTTRLLPLGLSVLLCFVLGTGGTTPISRAILHGAFDILTLDRFTFWATILILPFTGYMIDGLLLGRSGEVIRAALGRGVHRMIVGGIFLSMTLIAAFAAILPTIQPTQPRFIDPVPIAKFLEEDEHDRWRYLTLGFGDQFAYLSAQTEAMSVDGNYHSARRLPDMTRFSVERLENAKYLGVPGLGSLRQFLVNADSYNLRYVFSNDEFYDPILHFTGWTRLNRLANGVIVWERQDVTPLPVFLPRREISPVHAIMWSVLPPTALFMAATIFFMTLLRRGFGGHSPEMRPLVARPKDFSNVRLVRTVVLVLGGLAVIGAGTLARWVWIESQKPAPPETVIEAYFDDLDFRRFQPAYDRLDPETRPDFEEVMFNWRWRGGLLASYGKLSDMRMVAHNKTDNLIDWTVELDLLTSINTRTEILEVRTVRRGEHWFLAPTNLRQVQTPVRLQREGTVAWNVVGRRQPRPETDLHRDRLDRPRIAVSDARLVQRNGRYSVLGALTNADADPAFVSVFSSLIAKDEQMLRQSTGEVSSQRMLPAETSGFRIDFEGVLSLEDEEALGNFDPTLFIPPELSAPPDTASIEARAVVAGRDLYRGVALNGVRIADKDGTPVVSGLAVNTGTETATIIRIIALLYDDEGLPVWAEAGFVETNIYPGQSAPFQFALPARDEITVIADLSQERLMVNGSTMQADLGLPTARDGTLPMNGVDGYSTMRLHVSTFTYDPLF